MKHKCDRAFQHYFCEFNDRVKNGSATAKVMASFCRTYSNIDHNYTLGEQKRNWELFAHYLEWGLSECDADRQLY